MGLEAPPASPDRPDQARQSRTSASGSGRGLDGTGRPKAAAASARPAPKPHAPGDVEVEPITCWWKTDRNAVNVGERFTVTLTCSVVETTAVKVVPDLNQLEPTTVALQPFEVVKGVRHEDIRTPPLRYIQYEYTTRLIGDVFFGKDVDIPASRSRITSSPPSAAGRRAAIRRMRCRRWRCGSIRSCRRRPRTSATTRPTRSPTSRRAVCGRRVSSWRPPSRSASRSCWSGWRSYASSAGIAYARPSAARALPLGAVLRGCLKTKPPSRKDVVRDGWTPELAGRALAVFRIASAVALGRPVAQEIVEAHVGPGDGQLAVRKGCFRPKRALISTSTTSGTIARTLDDTNGHRPNPRTELLLNDLQESLVALPRGPLRPQRPARHGFARRRVRARHRRPEKTSRREPVADPHGRRARENRR